jgi:hypothetical protein
MNIADALFEYEAGKLAPEEVVALFQELVNNMIARMVEEDRIDGPAHDHDCGECVFVGGDAPVDGEKPVNQVDMWIHLHDNHGGGPSLIRRYSSDPPDYSSVPLNAGGTIPRYARVAEAARRAGLLD